MQASQKNLLSSFTFFYRYLFSKRAGAVIRRVSLICFLGLVISIGSLLIIFNAMGGLGHSIKESFLSIEPHVIVSFGENSSDKFIEKQKRKVQNILSSFGLWEGVSSFNFFENVDMVIRSAEGGFSGAVGRGYNVAYLKKFLRTIQGTQALSPEGNVLEGDVLDDMSPAEREKYIGAEVDGQQPVRDMSPAERKKYIEQKPVEADQAEEVALKLEKVKFGNEDLFFVRGEETQETKEKQETHTSIAPPVIMGLTLAGELDVYEEEVVKLIPAENLLLPPGEPVQFASARVATVVSTRSAIWNSGYIFYDRSLFPSFRENSSYESGLEIRLKEPENFLPYKNVLKKEGFLVEVWTERNSSVFFALKVEKVIMSVFLSLAGFITLLAVSSLLALLIVQKKKEIGILMAMGVPTQTARRLFTGVGLFLCFFGVLGGGLLSALVYLLLRYTNIPFLSQFHAGEGFPVEFNFWFMCGLFAGVFFLACFVCSLSVRSQLHYSPAELLKEVKG